ncbi:hypothetical protein [Flavobacterium sp. LC2016-01]|uniref:hypothetical protein n=1 Tax=Flavobacterium sp. LC2016-01 TaxID=2675876 RepID=UPI0012BAC732|nr:hypothetical protein [Flavobacterium sp. LC2016-01]MTH14476.1 hypothetical protein [Flavobacterium sp. LC2016-01]
MPQEEQTIYNLQLHQSLTINISGGEGDNRAAHTTVLRVPGGWVYTTKTQLGDILTQSSAFVPFIQEFKKLEDDEEVYE